MDIMEQITKVVDKLTKDGALKALFDKEPAQAVEKVLGVDLPDDTVNAVVSGVKAKLNVDKAAGVLDNLKKMF